MTVVVDTSARTAIVLYDDTVKSPTVKSSNLTQRSEKRNIRLPMFAVGETGGG